MAEDEESTPNVNNNTLMAHDPKPEFTATSPVPVVVKDTVLPVAESEVGGGADVAVAEGEKVPEVGESTVGVSCSNDEEVTETVKMENEAVAEEGNVTVLEKDETIEEAVNAMKEEEVKSDDEKVVLVSSNEQKDEMIEEALNATKEEEVKSNDEKVVVMSRNESESNVIIMAEANAVSSDVLIGANDEIDIVSKNDSVEGGENGEQVLEANASIVEACIGLGKDETMGAEKVVGTRNEDVDGKVVMTRNENENDETMAEAKEGDMSSDMLIGANNEATKDEEVEISKMKHEDEAMGVENVTDNAEKVVVTRKEEGDEMVSRDDSSAVEARMELEKDGEMEAIKHEELEIPPRKEEDVEMVSQVDSSAVEARLESEKDGEMEGTKHEEEEIPPRVFDDAGGGGATLEKEDEDKATGAENESDKAEKVVLTQNEIDDEMDMMKQDEVEPVPPDEDEGTGAEDEAANATTEETETDVPESGKGSGGKRKRKNTKVTVKSRSAGRARKTIGEDVCFICFDGGDLVLCDRRGCTKAYHPSCVDRDEDFFRAKGRWNCGWHQCTTCQKNAYYMCYTCTFSLCKGCIKDNVILCVRGNKGFCKNCMRTVKLIEGLGQEEKDGPIDFDDRSSFEYLFKDYFIDLKAKLSLSLKEIADAKNPWKGADVSATKQEVAETQFDNNGDGGSGSDASIETLVASKAKRRKIKKRSKSLRKDEDATTTAATISEGFSTAGTTEWASKELLELVKHMKSGDTSVLSQFDVQALLLEYIKTNKLRDPRRKSQIICDSRLERLFGKPRVGHFEMLKLLESHFLVKEDSQMDDVQGSVVDTEVNMLEADANVDTPTRGVKDRKRKRKKGENRGPQSNLDEYAAIDVHNISLIFLRRKLVEDLLEEDDKFHDKIVGTFVRIRISGNIQKQDLYRLVQVVGTSKAAEPYKLGKRTTDIVLEILNLNKTEVLSIDTISNQDFTEEECKRLRQSIKCGLINRLTVGDILDKAMEIQTARVNDWLESEILRLSHLRDRASEKGRKKELRECVEKLQLLKTPDERHRRLEEVPEIHADPKMDPSYESEDEDSESNDVHMRSRDSSFSRRGRGPVSPGTNFSPKDSWGPAGKVSSKNWELNRSSGQNVLSRSEDGAHSGGGLNEDIWSEGRERETESKHLEKPTPAANSDPIGANSQFLSRTESFSGASSVCSPVTPQSKVAETSIKINEAEKMWHYKDPSGKIQGPFSMVQLRKWSNTGYFPADLRIWKTTDKQEESSLLTDALAGRFEKVPSAVDNILPTAVLQNRGSERPQVDQNVGSQNSPRLVSSGGGMRSSVDVSALPTERWSNSDSMNLPSPTPKQDTASWVGGDGPSVTVANLYPSGNSVHQSPPAPPDGGVRTSASINNSGGLSVRGSENNYVNSGGDYGPVPTSEQVAAAQSGYSLQNAQSFAGSEQHIGLMNSQPGAQDAALQSESLNMQNPNVSVLVPGQPQGYGNWGAASSSVQNLAGNFSNAGASALPQPDYWRAPAQGSQQNIQPTTVPTVPWGAGLQENVSSSTGWGMMPGNPNLGWNGASPAIMNVNWGATVQAMPPGNASSGWVPTGPLPGSSNSGWVAQSGNPSVQGLAPGNANPGWVAPAVGAGSTIQGAPSGNGWAVGAANPGALTQGPPQGDSNQGRAAPTGNQGTRNNDHYQDRRFSGQMDKGGSRGSNSGYNNSRNWDRQSSFGSRGPGGSSRGGGYGNRPCPYYRSGRCKKGDSCNFIHN